MIKPMKTITGKYSQSVYIFLSIIPIVFILYLINRYGVNIPYWDQWDTVDMFEKYYSGQIDFYDLWRQQNEHRTFFPKLVFLLLGIISRYNIFYELYTSVLFVFFSYLIIIHHINKHKNTFNIENRHKLLWIIFSFFIFSPVQVENWLWGHKLDLFLNQLAVISGAYIFSNYHRNIYSYMCLLFCGIVAAFSLANGILYWIVIFLFLLIFYMRHKNRLDGIFLLLWPLFFSCVLFAYFYHFFFTETHVNSMSSFFKSLKTVFSYILVYLGSPLSHYGDIVPHAFIFGLLGLVLFIVFSIAVFLGKTYRESRPWSFFYIIGSYALLSSVLTAASRSSLGYVQAVASRYTTISLMFWLSTFLMLYAFDPAKKTKSHKSSILFYYGRIVILCVIPACIILSSINNLKKFQSSWEIRDCARQAIFYEKNRECLTYIYPGSSHIHDYYIPILKRYRLSLFSHCIPVGKPVSIDKWSFHGTWSKTYYTYDSIEEYFIKIEYSLSSCSNTTENTCTAVSDPITLDEHPVSIVILFSPGVYSLNQKIGIKVTGKEPFEKLCDTDNNFTSVTDCVIDLPAASGSSFVIFAEDKGSLPGECIKFDQPVVYTIK